MRRSKMKTCIFIGYFFCVLLSLNLAAYNPTNAIRSKKYYNSKLINVCRATQIYCAFENLYWIYKAFFAEASECDEQYYTTRLMINFLASLCIDLHIDKMNKENEELEKQIRDFGLEAS